jgi:hypothetical protein
MMNKLSPSHPKTDLMETLIDNRLSIPELETLE